MGVRASQHDERRVCAVEVVDYTGATERQVESEQSLGEPIQEAKHIRKCDERHADILGHPGTVMQRAANGHIAVQCHGSKDIKFSDHQSNEEETLSEAPSIGDCLLARDETAQHVGSNIGRVANVYKGEVPKEEVHGRLQVGIGPDQHNHAQVPCQCDDKDEQKHHEEDPPQHRAVCESHKNEFYPCSSMVYGGHFLTLAS